MSLRPINVHLSCKTVPSIPPGPGRIHIYSKEVCFFSTDQRECLVTIETLLGVEEEAIGPLPPYTV